MNRKVAIAILAAVLVGSAMAAAALSSVPGPGSAKTTVVPLATFYTGSVTINPNGSVTPAGAFSQSGSVYTLQVNINGTLYDYRNNTVIDGNGLTINGAGGYDGIYLYGVSGISISNLNVTNAYDSLYLVSVDNVAIAGLNLQSSQSYAIWLTNSNGVIISGNAFNATLGGVYGYGSSNITISDNIATNQSYDFISLYDAEYVVIADNIMSFLPFNYGDAILVQYTSHLQITANQIADPGYEGIYAYYSTDIQSSFNSITSTFSTGMDFEYCSHISSLHDSMPYATSYGLYAYNSRYLDIGYGNFSGSSGGYGGAAYFDLVYYASIYNSQFSNDTTSYAYVVAVYACFALNFSHDVFNQSADSYAVPIYLQSQTSPLFLYSDTIYNPGGTGVEIDVASNLYVNASYIDASYCVYSYSAAFGAVFSGDTFVCASGDALEFYGSLTSGVSVSDCTFVSIQGNGGYGIYIGSAACEELTISGNTFLNVDYAIYLVPGSGAAYFIDGNSVYNATYGIYVRDGNGLNISGNRIYGIIGTYYGDGYGVYAGNVMNAGISWNTVVPNPLYGYTVGIYLTGSGPGLTVSHNNITLAGTSYYCTGIELYNVNQAALFDNAVSNITSAYYFDRSNSISFFDNTANGTGTTAISSYFNNGFEYYGNFVYSIPTGLYSYGDTNGSVFANTLLGTSTDAFWVSADNQVAFYHNNILNGNSLLIYASYSAIVWNLSLPTGGNYWSSYTGTGTDGIGSTPYTLSGTYTDYLPLTSRWTSPTVTFVENGLPAGTAWSATLGPTSIASQNSTILFQQSNGEYITEGYTIGHVSGYVASSNSGLLFLNGADRVVTVTFTPYSYAVTFTASGLSSGTAWSVSIGGATRSSTTNRISFSEPNGTYAYSISSVAGYQIGSNSGSLSISGRGASLTVTYSPVTYEVTIVEGGLPSGDSWTVTVNGTAHTVAGTSITLSLLPGKYNLSVTGPAGYRATVQSQSVTVAGSNSTVSVSFARSGSATSGITSTPSSYEDLGFGAVLGMIVGVLVALGATRTRRGGKKQ